MRTENTEIIIKRTENVTHCDNTVTTNPAVMLRESGRLHPKTAHLGTKTRREMSVSHSL